MAEGAGVGGQFGDINLADLFDQLDFGEEEETPAAQQQQSPSGTFGGPSFGFGGGMSLLDLLSTPQGPGSNLGPIGSMMRTGEQERSMAFKQEFPRFLQSIMELLGFGGEFGKGPSREDLLDPRLFDIEAQRKRGEGQIRQTAVSQGRNVSGSVFQDALQQLGTGASTERQRATGDVDSFLAQLGLSQQGLMAQLMQILMGSFGGLK